MLHRFSKWSATLRNIAASREVLSGSAALRIVVEKDDSDVHVEGGWQADLTMAGRPARKMLAVVQARAQRGLSQGRAADRFGNYREIKRSGLGDTGMLGGEGEGAAEGDLWVSGVSVTTEGEEMEEGVGFGRKKAGSTQGGGSWGPLGSAAVTRQPTDDGPRQENSQRKSRLGSDRSSCSVLRETTRTPLRVSPLRNHR